MLPKRSSERPDVKAPGPATATTKGSITSDIISRHKIGSTKLNNLMRGTVRATAGARVLWGTVSCIMRHAGKMIGLTVRTGLTSVSHMAMAVVSEGMAEAGCKIMVTEITKSSVKGVGVATAMVIGRPPRSSSMVSSKALTVKFTMPTRVVQTILPNDRAEACYATQAVKTKNGELPKCSPEKTIVAPTTFTMNKRTATLTTNRFPMAEVVAMVADPRTLVGPMEVKMVGEMEVTMVIRVASISPTVRTTITADQSSKGETGTPSHRRILSLTWAGRSVSTRDLIKNSTAIGTLLKSSQENGFHQREITSAALRMKKCR